MDNEGHGMNSRLTIVTGTFSYLDNENHTAGSTPQGPNSNDLGAHAPLGLDQQKNDHLRSIHTFVQLLPELYPLVIAHFSMPPTGVCQLTLNGQ